MKKQFVAGISSLLLLSACGGGGSSSGGNGDDNPRASTPTDVNVAASANGATASATYNAASAANLVDGDLNTTWISDPDSPILITFGAMENINKIKLTRVAAAASLGSNADILVELSENGVTYAASNLSVITGGIACTSMTTNSQVMECEMTERATRYVRITTQNGKSFELAEFEAVARK